MKILFKIILQFLIEHLGEIKKCVKKNCIKIRLLLIIIILNITTIIFLIQPYPKISQKINMEHSSQGRRAIFQLKEYCKLPFDAIIAVATLADMSDQYVFMNNIIYDMDKVYEFSLWKYPEMNTEEQFISQRTFVSTKDKNTDCIKFLHKVIHSDNFIIISRDKLIQECNILGHIIFKTFKATEGADKVSLIAHRSLDPRHGFYQYTVVLFINGHSVENTICPNGFNLEYTIKNILRTPNLDINSFTYIKE